MKTIIFNNHISEIKSAQQVGAELLEAIMNHDGQPIKLVVDDGDGDVYVTEIHCYSDRSDHIFQLSSC